MGEGKRLSLLPRYLVFALISFALLQLCAADSVRFVSFSKLLCINIFFIFILLNNFVLQIFYESFEEDFEGRWVVSEKEDYQGKLIGSFRCIYNIRMLEF